MAEAAASRASLRLVLSRPAGRRLSPQLDLDGGAAFKKRVLRRPGPISLFSSRAICESCGLGVSRPRHTRFDGRGEVTASASIAALQCKSTSSVARARREGGDAQPPMTDESSMLSPRRAAIGQYSADLIGQYSADTTMPTACMGHRSTRSKE